MPKLISVCSPKGVIEEHTPLNARDLVNHMGWTIVTPGTVAAAKALASASIGDQEPAKEGEGEPDESDTDTDETSTDNDAGSGSGADGDGSSAGAPAILALLNDMTKVELQNFARERFNVELDGRKSEPNMIKEILELAQQ